MRLPFFRHIVIVDFLRLCGIVLLIEYYDKGDDGEEYILFDAQRGDGWCKFPRWSMEGSPRAVDRTDSGGCATHTRRALYGARCRRTHGCAFSGARHIVAAAIFIAALILSQ